MTEDEKIEFLSDKVKELEKITNEIGIVFPEKSFKLDGILIGNIVEVMVSHAYGIRLYKQSEKTHDGEVLFDGRKVQIKGTQKTDAIVIREKPDYLIVEYLDKKRGCICEIYNGPGDYVWEYASYVPSMNFYTLRVSKLLEIDKIVPTNEKITMIKMKDSETFDYSGVCLLVTKALEVETTKRFFLSYKNYLARKYNSVSRWPFALRQWNRGQITENVITDSEFTLGSVVSVIGMKREYDSDGNIVGYSAGHMGTKNEFLDYARNDLFKFSDRRRVEAEIDKDYHFIEKVRLDYRNPSAHRDRLTITSAKGWLEYVIDVQHMLKEMLSTMKI